MWGDLIRTCITIKLNNYDSEILIIDKSPLKLDVIDCINIDKGIKELKRLNIKREFIKNLKEIIKKYNIKEVFFVVQNSQIIIREYKDLPKIRKRDLDGYIKFEILQESLLTLDDYIVKYKILDYRKNKMDLQIILFPKEIEKICLDIATGLNLKHKYLNMNFDILQKLIDREKINLKNNDCMVIENMDDVIILNYIKMKKIYTSNVFSKESSSEYITNLLDKDIDIFYYGKEDNFINTLKENGFKVYKLNSKLNISYLCSDKTIDIQNNKYLVNIGVVI